MKKFLKIIGGILMAFNGLAVAAFVGTADKFIKQGHLGSLILLLAVYGALAYLGYRLYTLGERKSRPKSASVNARKGARLNDGHLDATPAEYPEQRAVPGSAETVRVATAYTVVANYLALPFHDGDNFFLFKSEDDAARFIRVSGRNDLSVRRLDSGVIERELVEYLCCGYTGAVIKNNLGFINICQQDQLLSTEDLIRDFRLTGLSTVGSIVPTAEKKMHLYLNQLSYTYRKYGADMSAVPEHWKSHLKLFKDEVIRYLLCADLCLPTSQDKGSPLTFSVMTVSMPSGQKWAALFTDMFAIFRYMRKSPNSIVFPNLLSDIAKDIREGRITGVAGILINPGREEFKMTVDEIAEQEAWLSEHPDIRRLYFEKQRSLTDAESKAATESAPAVQTDATASRSANTPEEEAPEPTGEAWRKIDLREGRETKPVTPGRGFFMGLLPGEKPFSEHDAVDADENRPDTRGMTRLDTIGLTSRWSEYHYDPKYRRIVRDVYSTHSKTGQRLYHGRKTILPLDLIDQYNQHPEDRNPEKVARIQRIQKIMSQESFGD